MECLRLRTTLVLTLLFEGLGPLCAPVSLGSVQAAPPYNVQDRFLAGEGALERGDLEAADADFRAVLSANANDVGALANLGVVAMRRRRWPEALEMLRKAQALAPQVAGIRLNIALVYYRQYDFAAAIPPLESVVRDQATSVQARYLLGLCYFFTDQASRAAQTLDGIWPQESGQMNYLYVLGVAAEKAKLPELQNRALERLAEVGQNTAELHLLMGKADLNRLEARKAAAELERAAQMDPKLPFVHYYAGVTYRKLHDFERAKAEFLKDAALEPDVAFNFDELGAICTELQQREEAARYFEQALRLDPRLASSYLRSGQSGTTTGQVFGGPRGARSRRHARSGQHSVHYLRGQVLQHLGRREAAQAEFDKAASLQQAVRDQLEREISGANPPEPDLARESQ
jgi:tetratricopeptide (TPR) repeat protein